MPRQRCCGHPEGRPCTCEMGNLYRFVEPIVLVSLARLGTAHGYQIARDAEEMAVTHAGLDIAAIYRALPRSCFSKPPDRIRGRRDVMFQVAAGQGQCRIDRNGTQPWHVVLRCQCLSPAFAQHIKLLAAVRANDSGHVLDQSDQRLIHQAHHLNGLFDN